MSPEQIGFLAMAALAVLGALGVVFSKSPVRSAMSLVLNFFVLAVIYFTLGAQLLGITQIMVYAGAIMVLFLFVIMLLKLQGPEEQVEKPDRKSTVAILLGLAIGAVALAPVISVLGDVQTNEADPRYGTPQSIGTVLFTTYAWPFLIASVLLLVGIVGSILLAKRRMT